MRGNVEISLQTWERNVFKAVKRIGVKGLWVKHVGRRRLGGETTSTRFKSEMESLNGAKNT